VGTKDKHAVLALLCGRSLSEYYDAMAKAATAKQLLDELLPQLPDQHTQQPEQRKEAEETVTQQEETEAAQPEEANEAAQPEERANLKDTSGTPMDTDLGVALDDITKFPTATFNDKPRPVTPLNDPAQNESADDDDSDDSDDDDDDDDEKMSDQEPEPQVQAPA
jgi:hypothetical protein